MTIGNLVIENFSIILLENVIEKKKGLKISLWL